MADVSTVAESHQNRIIRVSDIASDRALTLWRRMQFTDLDGSWAQIESSILAGATAAQLAATNSSESFVSSVAKPESTDGR